MTMVGNSEEGMEEILGEGMDVVKGIASGVGMA